METLEKDPVEVSAQEVPSRNWTELAPPVDEEPITEFMVVEEEDFFLPPTEPKRIRPEWVMGVIAILAAAVLLAVAVLCIPYYRQGDSEDPELLKHHPVQKPSPSAPTEETYLEPTEETEPEIPTIPPDPNPYGRNDFQYNRHNYLLLQNLPSVPGVDVSAYQGKINWDKVAASGIKFAMVRLGYRGYESGKLVTDDYAEANLDGAARAGLDIGAYFFSQALTIEEADQEIAYMLKILGERHLTMPIVLDWEIPADSARTANMDARTLTDIQKHFCQVMADMGYEPMVYFNWHQSETLFYLSELEQAPFWLALYQDRMTYPWKVEMWQYTDKGKVPGINGNVDLNVYFPE